VKRSAPKIDSRTAPDFFRQVVETLNPGADAKILWPEEGVSGALIKIFARFAELITDRLNRVPEKNFLAFLDLLGASLMPPRPARVPLTFSVSEAAAGGAVVPAGTEIAAVASEDDQGAVIYETEHELVVTSSRLTAAFTREPATDRYVDHSLLLSQSSQVGNPEPIFLGARAIDHVLYVAHDRIFNHPGERNELSIKLTVAGQGKLNVAWDGWDEQKKDWVQEQSGEIRSGNDIDLKALNASPPTTLNLIEKRWLRCRLIGTITPETALPSLSAIALRASFERKERAVENGFTNSAPIDLNRAFFPFGESPLPGDSLFLRIDKDFKEPDCKVTIKLTLSMVGQEPPTDKPRNAKVEWEYWDGATWTTVKGLEDNTANLTLSNSVKFSFPEKCAFTHVNGMDGYWIRARLKDGSYGPGAELKVERKGDSYTYKSIPAAAPLISSMKISYSTIIEGPPEVVLSYNDFIFDKRDALNEKPIVPFHPSQDKHPGFYLGFEPSATLSRIPNSKINLYVGARGDADAINRPEIEWQYSTDALEWTGLTVRDATANFTRAGVVEFVGPSDFGRRSEFGLSHCWLRAVLIKGKYASEPEISSLLLNTVMARHATRVENEILGSSDGSKNQKVRTSLAPVLESQRLEVRELEIPSAIDQDAIKKDAGDNAITIVADEAGRPLEIWVCWKQVSDFYGSDAQDRHYVLDHLTGEARFGDGISGRIPPAGSGNIRMASYRTGGGVKGNRPAGEITELRTTVPYVESVTNYIAASGGAEAETYDSLLYRMPRTIRHGGRAVTYEDFEDLAMLASPEVARARSVRFHKAAGAGKVSLIVVPHSSDPKPLASLELKRRVQEYLDARKPPLVTLTVTDPEYVEITIKAEIAPVSLEAANELKMAVLERLTQFLHPLSGGFEGEGWGFGRWPHDSDLYYLIEAVPGVDHVIALEMTPHDPKEMTERFLISSGKHEVICTFQTVPPSLHGQSAKPARSRRTRLRT